MDNSLAIDGLLDAPDDSNLVLSPEEEEAFDEWFLQRSLKQLFGAHSAPQLRMDVQHWVFLVPFVSLDYADPHIRHALDAMRDRFREMVERRSVVHNPDETLSIRIREPDDQDVAFRISAEFQVIPYRFSFEAVCLRLMVDPEVMREQLRAQMDREGITQLIENQEMAVGDKCATASITQDDMFGVDYRDVRMLIAPESIPGLACHRAPTTEVVEDDGIAAQASLFESLMRA